MSHHYKYDETGLPSSYLGLIILLPLFAYYLYKYCKPKPVCSCVNCKTIKKPKTLHIPIILSILVIFISYLLYNIFTIKIVHKMLYDPYKILGLEQDASEKEIKKAFKKIVKKSDPDKIQDIVEKEKMNEYLYTVNQAYNLLRDKKRTDKFSSITEETEEVVAIPKKIIENGWTCFICYIILLCVLLPTFAIKKWRQSTGCNRLGIRYDSVDMMYHRCKNDLLGKEFITGVRNIIWLLCEIEEIKEIKIVKVNEWVRKEIVKRCKKNKEIDNNKKEQKIQSEVSVQTSQTTNTISEDKSVSQNHKKNNKTNGKVMQKANNKNVAKKGSNVVSVQKTNDKKTETKTKNEDKKIDRQKRRNKKVCKKPY